MMLTKIGGVWVNLCEIVAAEHLPATKLDPESVDIVLQNGEHVLASCSAEEFDAALAAAGLLPDEKGNDLRLLDEDYELLTTIFEEGFRYLARDVDGKLYAYRHEPSRDGAYWNPAYQADGELKPLLRERLTFVSADDEAPFDLAELISNI